MFMPSHMWLIGGSALTAILSGTLSAAAQAPLDHSAVTGSPDVVVPASSPSIAAVPGTPGCPPATSADPTTAANGLNLCIEAASGSPAEIRVKAQLEALVARNDLSRWTFTHRVIIDERSIPHSHPVLTLHTRHARDNDLLLATYLHEQLHWWMVSRPEQTSAALADAREAFPGLPLGYPRSSDDAAGNELHVLVNYLEWQALIAVVGELRAWQIMEFWAADHYTRLYRAVLERPDVVRGIIRRHNLNPRIVAAGS